MASKFLDLIKRFSNSTSGSAVPLSPRRPRRVNPDVKPDIATGLSGTRPRYALGEPDEMTKLKEEGNWLGGGDVSHGRGGSVIPRPNRLKAALLGMLAGAGQGANRALQSGNVGVGGLAQALGAGIGGGAVTGIDPGIIQRQRHDQAVAENQVAQDREMQNLGNEAQLEDLRARAEHRTAQAEERRRQPDIDAAKLERQDAEKLDREFALAVSQILQQREKSSPEAIQSLIDETEQRFNRRVPVVPFKGSDSSGSGAIRTITNSDGSQSVIRFKDGSWEVEYRGERSATDVDRERRTENEAGTAASQRTAKINESSSLYRKADNNEQNAKGLESGLTSGKLFDREGNEISDPYEVQQEREARRAEAARLRSEARSMRVQGDKARSDGEGIYVPKRRSAVTPKSDPLNLFNPDSHQVSKAAWIASHPGGDWNEAKRVARARGYKITD